MTVTAPAATHAGRLTRPGTPGAASPVPDHPAVAPRTRTRMHHDAHHDPQGPLERESFEALLDRGSLGSPRAKAVRALTPPHVAQRTVDQHRRQYQQDPGTPPATGGAAEPAPHGLPAEEDPWTP